MVLTNVSVSRLIPRPAAVCRERLGRSLGQGNYGRRRRFEEGTVNASAAVRKKLFVLLFLLSVLTLALISGFRRHIQCEESGPLVGGRFWRVWLPVIILDRE